MRKTNIAIGQRYASLTVVGEAGRTAASKVLWRCKCDCGEERLVVGSSLLDGRSKTCGCSRSSHGMRSTSIYAVFRAMQQRCYSKKAVGYPHYGGRGITICAEWLADRRTFFAWAKRSGYQEGLTIDRIDNDGNYEPDNCRWTDVLTQANNKRSNRFVEFCGERKTIAQWARSRGLSTNCLWGRIQNGWPIERALNMPSGSRRGDAHGNDG
jgi:hypothetical protein